MCSSAVLPCPLCCKANFDSVESLKISLVQVSNRPLVCPICSEMLFGLDKLTIHLFSHSLSMDAEDQHSIKQERKGDTQKLPLNSPQSPSSSSHIRPPVQPPLTPTSPAVATPNTKPLSPTENANSTPSPRKPQLPVRCEICDFLFDNQKHLSMHMNLVHLPGPTAPPTGGQPSSASEAKQFPCHLCNKSFKMKGSLRVHLRVVHMHGFQNIGNNKGDRRATGKNTDDKQGAGQMVAALGHDANQQQNKDVGAMSPDQSKSWVCDVCTKSFTTKYFLKKHKRLHTGEMPYSCAICGKTFTFQQSYHKHLLYHSDEKPHVCATCGRAFKELSTLHNHERIHTGEKPFKCETCGKCFRQRVSYLVHRRIHDGSMPYRCTACSKSFRYKVSQRTHKCPAQPPGQVVRQSGELLQKLLQNSTLIHEEPGDQEDPDAEEERNRINELIDKSIEDMARGKVENMNELFPVEDILGISQESVTNSPSDQFRNLCLYSQGSPRDEDPMKELLYSNNI